MSDALTLSGGGSTTVALDTLFVDASRLGAAEASASEWIERFAVIAARLDALEGVRTACLDGDRLSPSVGGSAGAALAEARERIEWLRARLLEAAEQYGATERFVSSLWDAGGRLAAVALGALAPGAVIRTLGLAAVALPFVLAGVGIARLLGAEPRWNDLPLIRWLGERRALLNDPAFVRLVRTAADHADDFALTAAFGTSAGSIGAAIGAPMSASTLLGAAGIASTLGVGGGLLADGPVRIEAVPGARHPSEAAPPAGSRPVAAPTGVGDLAARVPPSDGRAQITVERYDVDGEHRWIVYVGGTVDFTLEAGREPFDMTSNVHGVADDVALDALRAGIDSAGAERAVRAALVEAGAAPGDPLVAVGHSGGGVIAAGLAADPELNVVAGVSLGGPVAATPIRSGVPFLSAEHAEDLVPATGGAGHPSPDRLVVSRSVLEPGQDDGELLPAHRLVRYQETADLIDGSEEDRLVAFRRTVTDFTGGAGGHRTQWRASRE
ncbi:hypothetical protein [Agromyces salentinus]|uniref:Alpha/beta hydrolase n=1 Tax=Agromyces salentinus TaxID=269421 RepID=A0ABN2MJK8_9MICO|nr:hypothetical protein [Agromyces salentinus]